MMNDEMIETWDCPVCGMINPDNIDECATCESDRPCLPDGEEHLVFVYGTLKAGYGNYLNFLQDSTILGDGRTTEGRFNLVNLGHFPAVVHGSQDIKGEVFRVDNHTFANLDSLEGEGTLYKRQLVDIELGYGARCEAWMYILLGDYNMYKNKGRLHITDEDNVLNWEDGRSPFRDLYLEELRKFMEATEEDVKQLTEGIEEDNE